MQPSPGATVLCNGTRLSASHWLRDGDVLRLGPTRVEVRLRADGVRLVVLRPGRGEPDRAARRPRPAAARRAALAGDAAPGAPIPPIGYTPRRARPAAAAPPRRRAAGRSPSPACCSWRAPPPSCVSRLAAVGVAIEPEPDTVALRGRWPVVRLGSRFVALPGRYTLVAEKAGYRRLEAPVEVTGEAGQVLRCAMRLLPGRLTVDTGGVAGAEVAVDGRPVGTTPLAAFEVGGGGARGAGSAPTATRSSARASRSRGAGRSSASPSRSSPLPTPPPGPPPPPRPAVLVLRSEPAGARVEAGRSGSRRDAARAAARAGPAARACASTKPGHDDAELSRRRCAPASGARRRCASRRSSAR